MVDIVPSEHELDGEEAEIAIVMEDTEQEANVNASAPSTTAEASAESDQTTDPTIVPISMVEEDSPPPQYDGANGFELNLLAEIKLDFEKAPSEYFDISIPSRLENRISNVSFTSRMTALNQLLSTLEMQRSIMVISYYGLVSRSIAAICAIVSISVFFITRNQLIVVLLVFSIILLINMPKSAKVGTLIYTNRAQELADPWTKEDELSGINLLWRIKKTFNDGARLTRIGLTVCVYEKIRLAADDVVQNVEALPIYVEQE
ncbi:hypothetical protein HK100_012344 [Physocladia obscura]|uniref:Uncharacterized protein n=1 Tax=Physocladia obscura TaxID=109957 RepID=A0AAD5SZW3_9FUNG|nr:hypothetical protein HK100_012344 [Physocladia obscura]